MMGNDSEVLLYFSVHAWRSENYALFCFRILQILESSFLFWQKMFRFQSILRRNSFSLVSSASAQLDYSYGHIMM